MSNIVIVGCRTQKELEYPEKLQATLADKTLAEACDLKRALERVVLLEAQLKDMNPNLDSISEYGIFSTHKSLIINLQHEFAECTD